MPMTTWGVALTILVTIGIVVAILLFERLRARRIEKDLRDQLGHRREEDE
jgi:protein-S-isoprenylcysteine O-methyltransferase Ste14